MVGWWGGGYPAEKPSSESRGKIQDQGYELQQGGKLEPCTSENCQRWEWLISPKGEAKFTGKVQRMITYWEDGRRTYNTEQKSEGHKTVRFWISQNLRALPEVTSFLLYQEGH